MRELMRGVMRCLITGVALAAGCAAERPDGGARQDGPGRSAPVPQAVPARHFRHAIYAETENGPEKMDVLFGPAVAAGKFAPQKINQQIANTGADFEIDRGYAYLVTTTEAERIMVPIYPKMLRSSAIRISTPGSRIMLQKLESAESGVVQRVYLRYEPRKTSTARVTAGAATMTLRATSSNQGQYAELLNDGTLAGPKDIRTAPAAVQEFIRYADSAAVDAGIPLQ